MAWEITYPNHHDGTMLVSLLKQIPVRAGDVLGDAAYLSSTNCAAVVEHGGTPFFRPKKTTKTRIGPNRVRGKAAGHSAFEAMIRSYELDTAAWMTRYGRRNTVESSFGGIKRRMGGFVRAATARMQHVEIGLQVLVWTLVRKAYHQF